MRKPRIFLPIGRPRRLGRRRALGAVEEYGTARSITLVVGQNKGLQPQNQSGVCSRRPNKFSTTSIDKQFLVMRAAQVGKPNVGATRVAGKGWFEGNPERSVSYEVAFIPNDKEQTFTAFRKNMDRLAEKLGCRLCQDSVLVIRSNGKQRSVASATCPRRKR